MIAVPLVFALLFAVALVWPVTDLAQVPVFYAAQGIGDQTPWLLLVLSVALPVVLYVAALLLGRGKPPFTRAVIFTIALGTTFALFFSLASLASALRPVLF